MTPVGTQHNSRYTLSPPESRDAYVNVVVYDSTYFNQCYSLDIINSIDAALGNWEEGIVICRRT